MLMLPCVTSAMRRVCFDLYITEPCSVFLQNSAFYSASQYCGAFFMQNIHLKMYIFLEIAYKVEYNRHWSFLYGHSMPEE